MYVQNTPIAFTWNIEKTADGSKQAASYYDLIVIKPDNTTTYTEGSAWTVDNFTAPATDTDGSLTETLTFTDKGLHEVLITTGTASNYTILSREMVYVTAAKTDGTYRISW